MGCVSSTLLNQDEEFPQIGFGHHIVSLTSTTYGLLTLDNPPPPPPPSDPQPLETINSWELMSGLDSDDHVPSFRYMSKSNDENANPNVGVSKSKRVVLYITSLRGVRKTFEDCEAVRSAIRGLGIPLCERDISMDRGFRDELRELMKGKGKGKGSSIPPRLFVDGRYVGGVEEVMKIVEQQGSIAKLLQLQGLLPISRSRSRSGQEVVVGGCACEGCGGVGFLPCFTCHGSCKIMKEGYGVGIGVKQQRNNYKRCMVLRCSDCNENGLVLCPICS